MKNKTWIELFDALDKSNWEPEVWKPIDGYMGRYEISSWGRIRSYTDHSGKLRSEPQKYLTGQVQKGYIYTKLTDENNKSKCPINHRLVAKYFLPNEENKGYVNHIDGVKHNNYYKNLEWCTISENLCHAYKTGLIQPKRTNFYEGENHYARKAVVQQDREGNFIREWASISLAARHYEIDRGGIVRVLKGRKKTAAGFKWIYKEAA